MRRDGGQRDLGTELRHLYLVTAGHVVLGSQPVYARFRLIGGSIRDERIDNWVHHPTYDIAVAPLQRELLWYTTEISSNEAARPAARTSQEAERDNDVGFVLNRLRNVYKHRRLPLLAATLAREGGR